VISKKTELLERVPSEERDDMSAVFACLQRLPDPLPVEDLIQTSVALWERYGDAVLANNQWVSPWSAAGRYGPDFKRELDKATMKQDASFCSRVLKRASYAMARLEAPAREPKRRARTWIVASAIAAASTAAWFLTEYALSDFYR
jgi:hypothetical protein